MQEFMRKFTQLNGVETKVVLEHCLFDKQIFYCKLQTINDDEKIGVLLKDQEIYMYKHDVKVAYVQDDTYVICDGRLTINVTKL